MFYFRFWCKFLCPIGAFNGLIGSFSLHKIRIDKETCNNCNKCTKACPMEALEAKDSQIHIDHTLCILCGKCLKSCPQEAIKYK